LSPKCPLAHLGGAGERDRVHVHVRGQGRSGGLAEARHHVDHAVGHAGSQGRHLDEVDPAAAAAARRALAGRPGAGWRPALRRLGFPDVPSYLRDRHLTERRTVAAIAAEVGAWPRRPGETTRGELPSGPACASVMGVSGGMHRGADPP
jgi:hypothetical protein